MEELLDGRSLVTEGFTRERLIQDHVDGMEDVTAEVADLSAAALGHADEVIHEDVHVPDSRVQGHVGRFGRRLRQRRGHGRKVVAWGRQRSQCVGVGDVSGCFPDGRQGSREALAAVGRDVVDILVQALWELGAERVQAGRGLVEGGVRQV